jgi:hypothetical protein
MLVQEVVNKGGDLMLTHLSNQVLRLNKGHEGGCQALNDYYEDDPELVGGEPP